MKLLSLKAIANGAKRVITRFPIAMLAAAIGTATAVYAINIEEDMTTLLLNLLLTVSLAAPLYVAAVLLGEAKSLKKKCYWGLHGIIAALLVLYFFLLPDMEGAQEAFYLRHTMWTIGFILVVTFVPFLFQKQGSAIRRFWEYNREIITAIVLTGIWAVALMIGISAALGAIDFLFEVRIDDKVYSSLWVILVGIFAPFFFLARMPENPHALSSKKGYPKEVRLFSQFALVPLVTVYFLILYAYTIKIVALFDWPEGQLAWIILGFSFVGVLTYLALHPLREKESWVRKFGTVLFVAMIPQTGMLFWALSFRLREYGFTENRYFVLVFGIWLLAMAIYYLAAKVKDIRIIPMTLFVLAVFTSVGPWGAFSVAENSQINRLEGILLQNNMLQNGLYVEPAGEIPLEDEVQISEIVSYLSTRHNLDGIESWFGGEDLDVLEKHRWQLRDTVIEEKFDLTVRYAYEARAIDPGEKIRESGYINIYAESFAKEAYPLEDLDYIVAVSTFEDEGGFTFEEVEYSITFNEENTRLFISNDTTAVYEFDLEPIIELGKVEDARDLKAEDATVISTNNEARLIIRSLYGGWGRKGDIDIDHLSAWFLF